MKFWHQSAGQRKVLLGASKAATWHSQRSLCTGWRWLIVVLLLFTRANAQVAESNSVRLAIGPFFTPPNDATLAKAASELPDLLTASLTQDGRFQLVERSKVNELLNEMHLTEAGLTAADKMVKLGQLLACDWLVSGEFVETASGTQIWVKVINTQNSVVLDLRSIPYMETNLPATASAMAEFLAQARAHTSPKEFIALGQFDDWSISAGREDWSQRLKALLEKHFLAAGYGVVERDAVAPIFTEYQFQAAGLMANATNRVKLKPAFWIVDGGCKWIHDTADKVSVSIRIQKMGSGTQMFDFVKPPGPELEQAVLDTVKTALTGTGSPTLAQAEAGEEKMRAEHLDELMRLRGLTPRMHPSTNQPVTDIRTAFKDEQLKTMQQAILLNPNDMHAKFTLGMMQYFKGDAMEKREAEKLLEEVAASGAAVYATRASNWLSDVRSGRITFEPNAMGTMSMVQHGQTASFPPPDTNAAARGLAQLRARNEAMMRHQDLVGRAASVATVPPLAAVTHFDRVSATALFGRKVYVACGTRLHVFDLDTYATRSINLPIPVQPIQDIEADAANLWLGTEGGLVRVPLAGGAPRTFTEKDGFPAPAITALKLANGRLYLGFNGAFGYLDLGSEKFTGMMAGVNLRRDWSKAMQEPPASPVYVISTPDGNNFWVSSQAGLQHFDLGANQWIPAFPKDFNNEIAPLGTRSLSVNSKYVVAADYRHCAAVCHWPDTNWSRVDLGTNPGESYYPDALALDPAEPDHLWITQQRKFTLLDLTTREIIAEGKFLSDPVSEWIYPAVDKVVFLQCGPPNNFGLFCLDKDVLFGRKPASALPVLQSPEEARRDFLQANFSRLVPVQFEKDDSGEARLQRLRVRENRLDFDGKYCCGFRFTVPAWLDGDLRFRYALAKTEAEKDYTAHYFESGMVAEHGVPAVVFQNHWEVDHLADDPKLQQQLPYTTFMNGRHVEQASLEAGKTYAIWFEFEDPELPDLAIALTVASARGEAECGTFPIFDVARVPAKSITPPASAEQLRSQFETALKENDRSTLLALVNWVGAPDSAKRSVAGRFDGLLLEREECPIYSVSLSRLRANWTTSETGMRIRHNIPLTGELSVIKGNGIENFPYGQIGNAFYIAVTILEPVPK
jgi:hypothetical protein